MTRLCGHALERGSIAAVVAEGQLPRYASPVGGRCLAVADTFEALKQLARAVRESWAGKLSVSRVLSARLPRRRSWALLGTKLRVLKSEGNLNNEYGLPLTCFRLDEAHRRQCWKWECHAAANLHG